MSGTNQIIASLLHRLMRYVRETQRRMCYNQSLTFCFYNLNSTIGVVDDVNCLLDLLLFILSTDEDLDEILFLK